MGYRGPSGQIPLSQIEAFCTQEAKKIPENLLTSGDIHTAVVLNVDDRNKKTEVRVGNFSGIIRLETMTWARRPNSKTAYYESKISAPSQVLKPGDIIQVQVASVPQDKDAYEFTLFQEPVAQAALLSIEAETGHVKAMIGGRDYSDSQFNRAYQSRRQPGSAFKPIVYAAALDKGYTPATVIMDSPVVYEDAQRDFTWKPQNYAETFYGPTLFREALVHSRNVVTIKILQDIGISYIIDYARKLGITSDISQDLSIALGSSGVSLLELVNAYAVFSNLGYFIEPVFITKIFDRHGNLLETSGLVRKKVIDMSTAYIMTHILESVVTSGTGKRVRALKRPVAGKTGTTNNLYDAWFLGYTPRYTTGVWVGLDQGGSLGKGETGSRTASPIWLDYMQQALEGKPIRTFTVPDGVVFAKIDAKTGLLPINESKNTVFECFKEGTVPTEYTPKPGAVTGTDDLFKQEF
jgi:penicillin-binding protein 1A